MDVNKMLDAVERMTPETGFNLVGVDPFETEPGEELYLIGHFDSEAEAEKVKAERLEKNPDETMYVYSKT